MNISNTRGCLPPPALGEHTETELAELGFALEEIAELRQQKIV